MKKVLIYIPSATAKHDSKAVEGLYYLLSDCWSRKKDGYEFYLKIGTQMFINDARNGACKWAMENGMDYILWLDDDMIIPPNVWLFTQLIEHKKDIIAPLFFTRKGVHLPLLFKKNQANEYYLTYDNILDYEKGLQEVDAVGFGCVLHKVDVLKKLKEPYFEYSHGLGEDIYFCLKVQEAGYKIYCDTNIVIGHLAPPVAIGEEQYLQQKENADKFVENKRKKNEKEADELAKRHGDYEKVDIVMPCYKNIDITRKAIESIYKNTKVENFNFIAVNDGNDKELADYFLQLKDKYNNFKIITNKKNLGFVQSVNKGLKKAKNDYIVIANNDIVINDPYWLRTMMIAFDDKTGMVVPTSNYVMGLQNITHNIYFIRKRLLHHYTKIGIGFFMLLKKEAVDKVGLLDERFGIGGNDDLDYSIRMREAGYNIKVARDVFIYHLGSKSLSKVCKDVGELDRQTRKILVKKWGQEKVDDLFKIDDKYLEEGEHE